MELPRVVGNLHYLQGRSGLMPHYRDLKIRGREDVGRLPPVKNVSILLFILIHKTPEATVFFRFGKSIS